MRKLFLLTMILLGVVIGASAQIPKTYIGIGPRLNYSTSYDPSPEKQHDGGRPAIGAHFEAGYDLRHNLQARLEANYLSKVSLVSIFTSDTDIGRKPVSEIEIRAGARYEFATEHLVRPLLEIGVNRYQQFFKVTRPQPLPDPLPSLATYAEYEAYEQGGAPPTTATLNPYLTIGVYLASNHEASFTRFFEDQVTPSQLSGYGIGYSYTRPLGDHTALKFGARADRLQFRDSIGYAYIANYSKRDVRADITATLIFH